MKLFVLLVMLSSSFARQLISTDEIEDLFKKYVKSELSDAEDVLFQEVLEILHRPQRASRAIEVSGESRMTIDCIICRSAFAAVIESVKDGQTDEQLTEVISTLCALIGIESYVVCRGAIELNMPIIHYIVDTTPEATPSAICGLVMQEGQDQNACPFTDSRFEWTVELPPPPAVPPVPIADDKPFTIALMTDFHIDPLYEAYGAADCDEPTCCRKGQRPATSYRYKFDVEEPVLARSIVNNSGSISLDLEEARNLREMRSMVRTRYASSRSSPPAGYWGDYRNCDTPPWAFEDAIDRITETHKNIDAVYYIGDTIDHFVWETTYELINDVNRYAIEKLRRSFGEDVPIIPVIGNHESQPTNQFAPNSVTGPKINTTWLYEALANKWSDCLPEDAYKTFKERGEFSILVRPGLRVITLNNNVPYRFNWWLVYDPQDSKRHLDWLVEELRKAELAGENVHILAHIPPGVSDLIYTWTREYNRIINRFSSIIKAQFSGHTHSDEFKLFYSPDGTPIDVAWGAGSVTSFAFYNLNYKIVTVDGATYEPQNIINYVYNLTEANLTPNRRPHWFQLYDMKNTFRLTDLSAASMNDLVQRMVTTDRDLLDIYSAFFPKLSTYPFRFIFFQIAPNSVTGPKINTTWLYEALANKWSDCLPEDAYKTFKERGEFSILVRPGLRVITLNNNVPYRFNWWLVYDPQDSKRHLDWLVEELRKAELAGENVHILAHIPPGVSDLIYTWTREYNRIINRFSSIIKAQFSGHTHSDEFKLFYSPDGTPIDVAWGAGSVTSFAFYNLNYKIVTVDGATYEPQNIINYVYNLTEANLTPNRRPHWFQLYDMKNTFRLTDLSAASMNDLVQRMVTTDRDLLDIYSAFFPKLSESRMSWCNDECKIDNVCKIVVSVLWETQKCEELRSIFYSRLGSS